MKRLLIVPVVLALAACNSAGPKPTVTEYKVVTPDKAMYECPTIKKWPNPDTLTDVQVAKTVVQLHKNNVKCKNSLDGVEKFIENSKKIVEQPNQTKVENNSWNLF